MNLYLYRCIKLKCSYSVYTNSFVMIYDEFNIRKQAFHIKKRHPSCINSIYSKKDSILIEVKL